MVKCKTTVIPLLTHWSYCSLTLSYRHVFVQDLFEETKIFSIKPQHSCSTVSWNPPSWMTGPHFSKRLNGKVAYVLGKHGDLTPAAMVLILLCLNRNIKSLYDFVCSSVYTTELWRTSCSCAPCGFTYVQFSSSFMSYVNVNWVTSH